MESIKTLYNPLAEDFTFRWDKIPYTVKAKSGMQLPAFLAHHGAKRLVDYILMRPQLWPDLGIDRKDKGDIRNAEGVIINEPDWTKDREPVVAMVLKNETQVEPEKKLSEGEKVKEKVEKLNEFEDLKNLK